MAQDLLSIARRFSSCAVGELVVGLFRPDFAKNERKKPWKFQGF
jgi:hypothetical protein